MSVWSKIYERINWKDLPQRLTALAARNLNKMDLAIDTIDDRVIALDEGKVGSVEVTDTLPTGDTIATITVDGTPTAIKAKQPNESEMNVRSAMLLLSTTPIGENAPFVKRRSGGNVQFPALLKDKIIGASVVWNQLVKNGNFSSTDNWSATRCTRSVSGNILSCTVTELSTNLVGVRVQQSLNVVSGHKYIMHFSIKPAHTSIKVIRYGSNDIYNGSLNGGEWNTKTVIFSAVDNADTFIIGLNASSDTGYSVNDIDQVKEVYLTDLTAMFRSTIADYVNTLETQTAGSGIAWLKSYGFFTEPYYAYSANKIDSVSVSAKKYTGKNQLPMIVASIKSANTSGTWNGNAYTLNGVTFTLQTDTSENITGIKLNGTASANAIFVLSVGLNTTALAGGLFNGYNNYSPYTNGITIRVVETATTDLLQSLTENVAIADNGTNKRMVIRVANGYTVPANTLFYPMIRLASVSDTTFVPYTETTYSLDNTTLRGLFKLDTNNKLYADGDIYNSDGSGEVKYEEVDMGSLNWQSYSGTLYYVDIADKKNAESPDNVDDIICEPYITMAGSKVVNNSTVIGIGASLSNGRVFLRDSNYSTASALITALSGKKLIYKKATPTTATLTPYTSLQNIESGGTEEFIDYQVSQGNRDVSIPVGGERQYYQGMEIPNLPTASGNHNLQFNPATGFSWS